MRAAPPVQVSVNRFGLWRSAVGVVLALVWLVVAGWVGSQALAQGEIPGGSVIAVAVAAVGIATWLAAGLLRVRPFQLRWDGRSWFLASALAEPVAGDLMATIDLGGWLLLRFAAERPGPVAVPRWLPVQRGGLGPVWHALRCAVHSPRPAPDAPVAWPK